MKKRKLYIAGLFLIIIAGCTKPLIIKRIIADQPGHFMYGGVSERNFYIPEILSDSLELNWIAETEGGFTNSSITVYDTLIITGDMSGKIYAFGNKFGDLIGKEKFKGSISIAPVLFPFRILFVVNEFDETYSTLKYYDYVSGKTLYENQIPGKCNNELLLIEDGVLALTENGRLLKYNLVAYKEWEIQTDALTLSSPASNSRIAVWGNKKGEIVGVDLEKAEIIYRRKISSGFMGGVSITDENGLIADIEGKIYNFELNSGQVNWEFDTGTRIISTPVADKKQVYCGNLKGEIYSLNKMTGQLQWKVVTNGIINAAPLVFENVLVQPDVNKKVHFISVENGESKKILNFDRRVKMSPVYFNNTLYFGVDNNKIHAYQVIESQ